MPELDVFDSLGNFTAAFKFKIVEYLKTIPLSDEQVESITKALTAILREALLLDAEKHQKMVDDAIGPLVFKIQELEKTVESHENQAKGMLKLIKGAIALIAFIATLVTIYQANKPDPNTVLFEQVLKEIRHASAIPSPTNHP